MGLRGFIFIGLFGLAVCATPINPFWGILAYLGHYYMWPENQWWGELISAQGIRMSLTISLVTGLSTILHWGRIHHRLAGRVIHSQEVLMAIFAGFIGLSTLYAIPLDTSYDTSDLFDKMSKVTIFLLLLTHNVTTPQNLRRTFWFMYLVGGVYLGLEARNAPGSSFHQGRLNILGGPDFSTSNYIAAHFVSMGIVGAGLIATSSRWWLKLVALAGGAIVANGVLMTQSRGAFVAMAIAGVCALVLANRQVRRWILILCPVVLCGIIYLANDAYWSRISTVTSREEERDISSQSRIDIWKGAIQVFQDNPVGVGAGRFYTVIGNYVPEHPGRDPHNTVFRCLGELGAPGILLFFLLHANALRVLSKCKRMAIERGREEFCIDALMLQLTIIGYLASGLTGTYLYTEGPYIFLLLPVCLERALRTMPIVESQEISPDQGIPQFDAT